MRLLLIVCTLVRNKTSYRLAVASNDDLLPFLDPIEETAKRVLSFECPNFPHNLA